MTMDLRLTLPLLALLCLLRHASAVNTRGMSPQEVAHYKGKSTVLCRDGSKEISVSRVNDDYCDCVDGTDEPGTSACPSSTFYCRNRGHTPIVLFSSRVNDGICDCCDGSDEYNGWVVCNNTCIEAGAEARKALVEGVGRYKEGVKLRDAAVSGAKEKRQKWEEEAARLEAETAELEAKEKEVREAKEALEKAEREEKEWREKLEKEQQERERLEKEGRPTPEAEQGEGEGQGGSTEQSGEGSPAGEASPEMPPLEDSFADEAISVGGGMDGLNRDELASMEEEEALVAEMEAGVMSGAAQAAAGTPPEESPQGESDEHVDPEHLSKEEIGRRIAERWTGHHEEGGEHGHGDNGEHGEHGVEGVPLPEEEEEGGGFEDHVAAEAEHDMEEDEDVMGDGDHSYLHHQHHDPHADEGEEEEDSPSSMPAVSPRSTWWARALQWPRDVCSRLYSLVAQPPAPQLNHTELHDVRRQHSELSQALSKAQSRLRTLKKKLEADYGPEGQFIDLADKCFNFNVHQYVYSVCPFKHVKQKEGHSETTVGQWKGFAEDYTAMVFDNGDHCWNGPNRSMKVWMECGASVEILSVEEPSRCEYSAKMTTPAMCLAHKAKELQEELERQESEIQGHDEL